MRAGPAHLTMILFLWACGDEDPYHSQRCKELRQDAREIEDTIVKLQRAGLERTTDSYVLELETLVEENPECFDPSL